MHYLLWLLLGLIPLCFAVDLLAKLLAKAGSNINT